MTPQKELQAIGMGVREARMYRHLGQMYWKQLYRDPAFRKANPVVRMRQAGKVKP